MGCPKVALLGPQANHRRWMKLSSSTDTLSLWFLQMTFSQQVYVFACLYLNSRALVHLIPPQSRGWVLVQMSLNRVKTQVYWACCHFWRTLASFGNAFASNRLALTVHLISLWEFSGFKGVRIESSCFTSLTFFLPHRATPPCSNPFLVFYDQLC